MAHAYAMFSKFKLVSCMSYIPVPLQELVAGLNVHTLAKFFHLAKHSMCML